MDTLETATQNYLLYVVVPLWLVSGVLDWGCHRRAHIETTSGLRESLLHCAMMVQVGIPILLGLFAEINALVLVTMVVALAAHSVTAVMDSRYANKKRHVSVLEQHLHSALEFLPFMAVSMIVCLHWRHAAAIFTADAGPADWALRAKAIPLAATYRLAVLAAAGPLLVLPYLEELVRCVRHTPQRDAK